MKNYLLFVRRGFGLAIAFLSLFSCTKDSNLKKDPNSTALYSVVSPKVINCLPGYQWDYYLHKCVPICPTGYHNDSITGACVINGGGPNLYVTYAGVQIGYYTSSHLLSFSSTSDVNTVLDQLDNDYETYNTNYENQYPNYTADQLDSMDSINNFDELKTYRDFEAKFSGYNSERSNLENIETTWLNNNMTDTDPDSLDYAIDNSENAICNNNYQVMISGSTYQWTADGLVLAGGGSLNPLSATTCFTNRKRWAPPFNISNRSFRVKAAIHYCIIRTSVKGKVVSYKLTHGKWKRAGYDLSVGVIGTVYASDCNTTININKINPTSGYKKRRELKVTYRDWGVVSAYYTRTGLLGASFFTPIGQGSVIIQ